MFALHGDLSHNFFEPDAVDLLHLLESKFVGDLIVGEDFEKHHTEPVGEEFYFLAGGRVVVDLGEAERLLGFLHWQGDFNGRFGYGRF